MKLAEMKGLWLLLQQAGVAGNALPLAKVEYPGIGETSYVVIRLALVGALRVIDAGNHRGIAKEIHFYVLDIGGGRSEERISDISQKLLLIAEFSVVLGIDEPARNQSIQSSRIALDLRFIPQMLKNQQLALARIGLLSRQAGAAESYQTAAKGSANH